ncbi:MULTISPECIES: Hcp family type VI secretion system effector [Dickeya]|uniref:Hcp family type VI secretion system effector n=1 Tax=Dickeya TaxID=204037 RepID=UPI00039F566B|nr:MULTISPECIES: Hcp family type VI secretion system effector [Dickeya]AYH49653.1 Hcp1 family type VI secretion system effector [Dickeya fangzhongdai]MBO8135476.1 Hcp family type VI secretion system effector [Dickeya fangzhongdai]UGA50582.1 Hcp family type VI secretion system effector [Dickeya fangzhongdai]ULR30631.1 Hcp family type VI secretion system effector [Dickeya fangzhongdai]UWH06937.1 Hcp family type VI secretion system effector [Dickeya fangzhongdai]
MSHVIYLTLEGNQQGLISSGCSTFDSIGNRYQKGHEDQIQVLGLNHTITREENVAHHPIQLIKPIDKSSPLLGVSVTSNESLTATFFFYRTNQAGQLEVFYELKLTDARVVEVSATYPHSLNDSDSLPYEVIMLRYNTIAWTHKTAGTSGYSIWNDSQF